MKSTWPPKILLCAFGLFLVCGAAGLAQEESSQKTPIVRFTVWGDWAGKELYLKKPGTDSKPDDGYLKLALLDLGYSTGFPFSRAKPIELCTQTEKDGEPVWQTLLNVGITAEVRESLVMIFPKGDGKGAPEYRVFDLDASTFSYGSYQLVNLTESRLLARLDEKEILLRPGAHGHFKGTEASTLNVWLRVAAEGKDKSAHVAYSSMMKNRSDKRMFMFFHASDASPDTPIDVRTLVDFAPPPKPKS